MQSKIYKLYVKRNDIYLSSLINRDIERNSV